MTISARWDEGVFGDSQWDTLVQQVTGDIAEGPDSTNSVISPVFRLTGNIVEAQDIASGSIDLQDVFLGLVNESPDVVYNVINVKYAYRGGWAPQFHYRREWEPEPEVPVEELAIEVELEPEFIPQPLPIDPTVARMIEIMMRGPQVVSTDEDDLESILMNL
jgi:hypothetical protein